MRLHSPLRSARWLALGMVGLALTGCVTRNTHELVLVQLDATRAALSDQQATCRASQAQADTQLAAVRERLHDARIARQLSKEHADALELQLEALRAQYAELLREASRPVMPPPAPPPARRRGRPIEPAPAPVPEPLPPVIQAQVDQMLEALEALAQQQERAAAYDRDHQTVVAAFAELAAEGWVTVAREDDASVIRFPASKLYQDDSVYLSERGQDILKRTAIALDQLHGSRLELEGHTDTRAFHSAQIASNWELGFARAIIALRFLRDAGVDQAAHASSWADGRPLLPGDSDEAQRTNARVELWIRPIARSFPPGARAEQVAPTAPAEPTETAPEPVTAPEVLP